MYREALCAAFRVEDWQSRVMGSISSSANDSLCSLEQVTSPLYLNLLINKMDIILFTSDDFFVRTNAYNWIKIQYVNHDHSGTKTHISKNTSSCWCLVYTRSPAIAPTGVVAPVVTLVGKFREKFQGRSGFVALRVEIPSRK